MVLQCRQEPAIPLLNLRVGKKFYMRGRMLQFSLDALNLVHANAVKAASYVSGPSFRRVTDVVPPRQFRFGTQWTF